jgi:hypothetical protein
MQHYSIYFNVNTTQRLNVQVDLLYLLVLTCVDHFNDHFSPQGWFQKVGGFIPLHPKCLRISEATGKIKQPENNKGPELFWELCFFRFGFSWDLLFCPFSLQFAAFWSWKLPFQRYCNILEFEPLIFHDICNILVLKLFILDGILRPGFI